MQMFYASKNIRHLFILILFWNLPIHSEENIFENQISYFKQNNYILYVKDIKNGSPVLPVDIDSIEEAESLNYKGLELLHKSCGREDFYTIGMQFLPIIGFSELERLNEFCIQEKNIAIDDEFKNRNNKTRLNTVLQKTIERLSLPEPILLKKVLEREEIYNQAKKMEDKFHNYSKYYMNFLTIPMTRKNQGILPLGSSGGTQLDNFQKTLKIIHNPVKDKAFKLSQIDQAIQNIQIWSFIDSQNRLISFQLSKQERIEYNRSLMHWFIKRNKNIQINPHISKDYKNRIQTTVDCFQSFSSKHYEEVNFLMWAGFFQDYGFTYIALPETKENFADLEQLIFKKIYTGPLFRNRLEGLEHGCKVL